MPKALKVTEDNLTYIIEYGKTLQFRLDDIKYDLEDTTLYGVDLYQITDGTAEDNNVTFTTMWGSDFFRYWKFKTAEMPTEFVEIEHV